MLLSHDHSWVSTLPFTGLFKHLCLPGHEKSRIQSAARLGTQGYTLTQCSGSIKHRWKPPCSCRPHVLQSQVYRNQPDPASAAYDTTVSTLAAEYSYGPYPHQPDASQNYYMYPPEYSADNTWSAPEQRETSSSFWVFFCESRCQCSCIIWLCDLLPPSFPPPAPPRPATPEKFTVPHRCARFGPGGHLIQVLPNLPSDGQPALVDIHSMEVRLGFFFVLF